MTPSITVPDGRRVGAVSVLLVLWPLVTYASTLARRFGLRDDYALLREAAREPGKILRVTAGFGRPVYGALLEPTARLAGDIQGLSFLRVLAALCLGLLAVAVFRELLRAGWRLAPAALLSALLPVLPSAQVIANWGICWPHPVSMLLSVGAYALARRSLPPPPAAPGGAWGWRVAAVGAVALATLTYQVGGLFYVVLLAAALVVHDGAPLRDTARWLTRHLVLLGTGLLLAFCLIKLAAALGWLLPSVRIAFERHWGQKLVFLLSHLLPNAIALIALDNGPSPGPLGHHVLFAVTVAVLAGGLWLQGRRAGLEGVCRWLLGLGVLSATACSVSFVAGERWPTYRVIYALTGVWSVFFVASLVNLGERWPGRGPRLVTLVLVGFVATGALLAHRQSLELFAHPQERELALMEEGVRHLAPPARPRIFVRLARQTDTTAPLRYVDEFGSVSADAEWVAKEMLQDVVHERFPKERDVSRFYAFAAGTEVPAPGTYDILIDMRERAPRR